MLHFSTQSLPVWALLLSGFILAFVITLLSIPSIVRVAQLKGLSDTPNSRTSHQHATPTLGGIGIFAGVVISTVFIGCSFFTADLGYVIAGLIIIFFTGIKDDILVIDPKKKLAAQVAVAFFIGLLADIHIDNLYGLFGIYAIPFWVSLALTVFVFIVIDNGFNLIDGIDGLSSGIGFVTSVTLGVLLLRAGDIAYAIMSFAFAGSLVAFFRFNVFSKLNKIFLGDTGSLIIGMVVSLLTIRFLQVNIQVNEGLFLASAPALVIGILIIPLFDTLRVFSIRMLQGKSPFEADRQHIHHRVLQLGCTHVQGTMIIISANVAFIGISFLLQGLGIIVLTSVLLSLALLASWVLMFYVKRKVNSAIPGKYVAVRSIDIIYKERRSQRRKEKIAEKASELALEELIS